jgi:hypothetical protein
MDDVIERVMRTYALMVALTPALHLRKSRLRGNALGNF